MAWQEGSQKKCFTFIWKLENVSYLWQKRGECIASPSFVVNEIEETSWSLLLYPRCGEIENYIGFYLQREADCKGGNNIQINYDLAFLQSDGTVLKKVSKVATNFHKNQCSGPYPFAKRTEIFGEGRVLFLPKDILMARCRLWKSDSIISKDILSVAHTCIGVEKTSFMLYIKNFSTLQVGDTRTYEIKLVSTSVQAMRLKLFVNGGLNSEQIHFSLSVMSQKMEFCSLQLLPPVDTSNLHVECFKGGSDKCAESGISKEFFIKSNIIDENRWLYLQNDSLPLLCLCQFSFGIVSEEIKEISPDNFTFDNSAPKKCSIDEEDELAGHQFSSGIVSEEIKEISPDNFTFDNSAPKKCSIDEDDLAGLKDILIDDFKSMLHCSILSDVKLKVNCKTYPAHKCILSVRSPVFKAMFSNDMRENITDCVDIQDLKEDTVFRMLQYIYTAEVEELGWCSATDLYEAADKYEILTLKNFCSSYLKNNLCPKNACDALVLADLHQDEGLKCFVQDFILWHDKDIMNSEEWKQLMETNLKLAAQTMHLKFKK